MQSKIKRRFPHFFYNKLYISTWILGFITIAIVLLSQQVLPPQVPLFYGTAEGEQQLTISLGLVLPGVISLAVLLINSSLIAILKDDFLQKTLVLTSFIVAILAFITSVKILFLVGNF